MGSIDETAKRRLEENLQYVTPLQRRVMVMRFGLLGESLLTMERVQDELEMTREEIRREEAGALKRIRQPH
jgi:RNA polymerase primary sigma factor